MTVLLATAGLSYYRFAGHTGETIDSVAVLPFVNASGDPNTEYFSDGITESLINSLSQLPNLKIKSRDSVFHYKGKDTDAQQVGRELGVRAIFKGRLTQQGDTLAISAELIDARNDDHIWGQQYNRKLADIFVLQEEIAKEITDQLRVRLTGEEQKHLDKHYTVNPEAYQDYLKGRYWWNKQNREGFEKGIEYFQQAIAKDPNYALAYAGLADSYLLLPSYGFAPAMEAYPKAKENALKALELDDTLAEAHTSLGNVKTAYDWDWSGAEKEFRRAIDLNPNYAIAHQSYGLLLARLGRAEQSIAGHQRALELDPLSVGLNRSLGAAFFLARQYDQGIEQLKKTLEMDPNFISAHGYLGDIYVQKLMFNEAIAEFEKMGSPGFGLRAYAYAKAGRRAEAEAALAQLKARPIFSAGMVAAIYTALGNKEKAFEWLNKSFEDRTGGAPALKLNPGWDPLRSDPRFADLLRRMNLQP